MSPQARFWRAINTLSKYPGNEAFVDDQVRKFLALGLPGEAYRGSAIRAYGFGGRR